ncbi:hypothetical protein BDN72DRAFT_567850 [Pluteus cervinus]|uniref:Uncharacterized protein n=1 Tax=Pluteus cervinus TaxID=181527 RepID=A0ACD3A3C2_9AGAR|nr:hypothetical protein BDN72DRAFT_567850 [Pluteus cervinus]
MSQGKRERKTPPKVPPRPIRHHPTPTRARIPRNHPLLLGRLHHRPHEGIFVRFPFLQCRCHHYRDLYNKHTTPLTQGPVRVQNNSQPKKKTPGLSIHVYDPSETRYYPFKFLAFVPNSRSHAARVWMDCRKCSQRHRQLTKSDLTVHNYAGKSQLIRVANASRGKSGRYTPHFLESKSWFETLNKMLVGDGGGMPGH